MSDAQNTADAADPATDLKGLQRPRGGKGKYAPRVATAERDSAAATLRSQGHTFAVIAQRLGYADKAAAEKGVKRALEKIIAPGVEAVRKSQQELLDLMKTHAVDVLQGRHPLVSNGHVVGEGCNPEHAARHPEIPMTECYGPPLLDAGPRLAAITSLTRVLEREARLHGSDSPIKVEREENGTVRIEIKGIDADKL